MARFGDFDQYLDNAGDPLSNGKLYFYESGTTTPKTTYSDINNSIPNTNPVLLSASGRQPNIFFDGVAKVILADNSDAQIAVRDPVGETATDFGDEWVATKIYNAIDVVLGSDGIYYRSLINGNQNNNPVTTTGLWTLLYSVEWNQGITYSVGDVVTYGSQQYQSLQNSNLNQNPSTQAAYWVGLSFAWLATTTYETGMNAVGTDGVLYTSLQDSNTGNDPATSPAYWVGTSAAAAASAVAAAASAAAALVSENAAADSETAAAASETAAAASETAAAASESAAATSETNAANSASAASTSETNAAASETAAAASASAASTSETNAAASASAASTSETNAAASETAAAASEAAAAASESAAATSETNAANSASAASTSASNASTSETNAASSATAAAGSATAAASSATAAQTAETGVEAAVEEFEGLYLGAKSTPPTTDNQGNPLQTGTLYFNTVSNTMFVYTGSSWAAAGSAVNGTAERQEYIATSGQTNFSATYDVGFVDVYLNGIKLIPTVDFTATDGATIVLTTGATTGDNVSIIAYGAFNVADVYTQAQSDARYAQIENVYNKTDSDARYTQQSNNLSDLDDAATALTNLGLTATATELNYVDGVTSNIQTQIDNIDALPSQTGNDGKFLTTDGTDASWVAVETGTITATASGALTNGCPVVINSNGTVSKTYRNQQTEATGSATDVFDLTIGDNDYIASCYVPDTGDIWFCYSDNNTVPYFRRISVNGTGISSGAANNQVPSQGANGEGRYAQICYIGNSKVAIVFSANNDGNAGLCVIATVAGNGTATFGTPVEFVSNSGAMSVCYDSDNDKIVVVYRDDSNSSFGKAVIGTVSGTSVTFGTPITFQNGQKPYNKFNLRAIYIPEQQLIVCQYRSLLNGAHGFIESFSTNGTTLTNVDQALFSGSTPEFHDLTYAPDKGVLISVWTDQNDSDNGKARTYTFYENKNFNSSGGGFVEWDNGAANYCVVSYDPNAGWFYLVYTNLNQSSYPYRKYIKMNSLNVPYDTNTEVLYSSNTTRNGLTYDPVEKSHCFIGYQNAAAHQIGYDVTNLQLIGLGSNYIGVSDADYADGATAKVQIVGAVDDAQTGLTTGQVAYVTRTGTISSTADSPNVVAGTAISATQIIVKG